MPDWLLIWKQYNDELVLVMTNTGSHSKEGSTSHLGLLPSGKKRETALLGARNRYAIRLADQSKVSPGFAGWDRLGKT